MANKHSSPLKAAPPPGADDLKCIIGIGPTVERRLYDANILTFAQLAALSPEEVAALVADLAGLSVARIAKQDWIGQARERMPTEYHDDTLAPAPRQHYATFTVELLLGEDNDVRRTRVTYVQAKHEQTWAGWEDTRLVDFFIQQAALHLPSRELVPLAAAELVPLAAAETVAAANPMPAASSAAAADPVPVPHLEGLEVLPAGAEHAQSILRRGQPCSMRVALCLADAGDLPDTMAYTAAIYARSLSSGSRQVVGETRGALATPGTIAVEVGNIALEPGIYRTEVVVALRRAAEDPGATAAHTAFLEGGLLHIY